MSKRTSHPRSSRFSVGIAIGALLLLLAIALAASPARAAHPYGGAPIVYVGLEDHIAPEEGFAGFRPAGLRSIQLGEPKTQARVLSSDPGDSDPAASPDGRWIAFGVGGIALMRSDGSGLRRLTDGGGEPSFDRSSKRILFVRGAGRRDSEGDIYEVGIDGSGLRRLTSGAAADRSPVFSPNGRQIVFGRTPAGSGFQHLYSIRPDGSHLRDLTPRIPARSRRGERNFSAEDPTYSPNGRTIAFTVGGGNGTENIYTMRPNGNRIQSLTGVGDQPLSRRFKLSEAAFSPSGRFLLVTARDSGHSELALIDLADRSRLFGTGSGLQGEAGAWLGRPGGGG